MGDSKKLLTKKRLFEIINKEIEDIKQAQVPTWGYSMWDVLNVLEQIKTEIGDLHELRSKQ